MALTVPTWAPALTPLLTDHSSWRASRRQGQVRRHRHADGADGAQAGHAVPLPLQGAADLLGDADHAPGAQPGARPAGGRPRGGGAASLTPAARSGTSGALCPSRSSSASMTSGSNLVPAPRAQLGDGLVGRQRRAIGAVGGHRDVGVAGEDDARADRDPVAREAVRVAACRPSARARGGRSARSPPRSLVRSRIRSPATGCSAITSHSSAVSGPCLCRISAGIASLPTSCSSARVGDPLDLLGRRPSIIATPRARCTTSLGVLVRVVVALLDRGGERLHGGGGAALRLQQRELALDLGVGDRDAALAGALGQHQRAVGLLEQRRRRRGRRARRRRRSSTRRRSRRGSARRRARSSSSSEPGSSSTNSSPP